MVADAFGVAHFRWSARDRDKSLEDGVNEDPADFAGICRRDFFFFTHSAIALKASVFSDDWRINHSEVLGIGSCSQGVESYQAALVLGSFVAKKGGDAASPGAVR